MTFHVGQTNTVIIRRTVTIMLGCAVTALVVQVVVLVLTIARETTQ